MKEEAQTWVYEAGERIRVMLRSTLEIDTKSNENDLVTNADKETETFLVNKIKKSYPDHKILGEEGIADDVRDMEGHVWIIDPIDGTMNFVHFQRFYAISLALYLNGQPLFGYVYDVYSDELYFAEHNNGAYINGKRLKPLEPKPLNTSIISLNTDYLFNKPSLTSIIDRVRGVRTFGVCSLEMAFVASGKIDAFISDSLSAWDYSAGKILVEETGGRVVSQQNEAIHYLTKQEIVVSNPSILQDILSITKNA